MSAAYNYERTWDCPGSADTHAKVQADRLAAKDRGYLRQYFPDLAVLRP